MTEGVGHNSMGMDEATFHRHVALISRAEIAMEEARALKKKARKGFQADGGVLGDLDYALRLKKLGHEETMATVSRTAGYMVAVGALPAGTQLDLFDRVTNDPAEERAHGAGFWAGLTGKDMDCPHEPGVPQRNAWLKGWHEGHAKFVEAGEEDQTLADINARDADVDMMEPNEVDGEGHQGGMPDGGKPPMPYYQPSEAELAAAPALGEMDDDGPEIPDEDEALFGEIDDDAEKALAG